MHYQVHYNHLLAPNNMKIWQFVPLKNTEHGGLKENCIVREIYLRSNRKLKKKKLDITRTSKSCCFIYINVTWGRGLPFNNFGGIKSFVYLIFTLLQPTMVLLLQIGKHLCIAKMQAVKIINKLCPWMWQ